MDLIYTPTTFQYFVFALFLFAQISITAETAIERLIVVTLVALLSAISIKVCSLLPIAGAWYAFIVIVLCTYLGQFQYFLAAFTVSIFTLLAATMGDTAQIASEHISGIFIAWYSYLLVLLITTIGFKNFQYRQAYSRFFYHLRQLNKEVFACFLNAEYQQQLYLYEHRLHEQKRQVFTWLQRLKQLITPIAIMESKQFETILDLTLDYSQLRSRINDPATFELCAKELTGLMLAIDNIYTELMKNKKKPETLNYLNAKIEQFEVNYQQILQVAARDPIDFMLFLQTFKMLQQNLSQIIVH